MALFMEALEESFCSQKKAFKGSRRVGHVCNLSAKQVEPEVYLKVTLEQEKYFSLVL